MISVCLESAIFVCKTVILKNDVEQVEKAKKNSYTNKV